MYIKRFAQEELIRWKKRPNRKPLIIKGARQVGKTRLIKEFGKSYFADVSYFNFDEEPELKKLFETTKDVNRIIDLLSLLRGKPIQKEETLIVFDEIQECTDAINFLKYINENAPEYALIAAGSLLGVSMGRMKSFPVGKVEFLELYPIQFSEYLYTVHPNLFDFINQININEPIPEIFFNLINEQFILFTQFGGMPEVLNHYLTYKNADESEIVLKNLLTTYAYDFSKYAETKDIPRIHLLWESLPSQLSKENKKFVYQQVKEGARAREYEDALNWLIRSGLVYKISLNKSPKLPLSAYDDLNAFKLYCLDIGLIRQLSRLPRLSFLELNQIFVEFKGSLAENYVLQSLLAQGFDIPRYWSSSGKAEVDFIIQHKTEIIPIEVKSGNNVKSKSLAEYDKLYKPETLIRFSVLNLQKQARLMNFPLFLSDWLHQWI